MTHKPTYRDLEKQIKQIEKCNVKSINSDIRFTEDVLDTLTDTFVIFNLEGRLLRWNNMVNKKTGYTNDEISAMKPTDFFSGEDIQIVSKAIEFILKKESASITASVVTKNGQMIPYEFTGGLIKDTDGNPISICIVGRDITERTKVEEELRKSEERLHAIFEASPNPVVVYNIQGYPEFLNPAFTEIFGWSLDEIQEKLIPFVPDDLKEGTSKIIQEIYRTGKPMRFETKRLTKDSRILDVLISAAIVKNTKGEPEGMVVNLTDLTERKKLEEQLQHAQKMEAIGTLAGGVAHDFNNILSAIFGYTQLSQINSSDSQKVLKYLDQIFAASQRAKGLVQQILTFSRQGKSKKIPCDIGVPIKEALKLLRASLPATIEIRENVRSNLGSVMADQTQIHQVLMNLCTNALHAMEKNGGILDINLTAEDVGTDPPPGYDGLTSGRYLKLTVTDTGYGIEPAILERIFEPYFTTKELGEGTGMGMAMVHGIIKDHSGTIKAYSEPGSGTTFHVYFPCIEGEVKAVVEPYASMPKGNEQILFVDDEKLLIDVGQQILEDLGYKVETRMSPYEALEAFRTNPRKFDLIITDMTMPKMTGEILAQEIIKIRSDIPIILCTGFSKMMATEKASEIGIKGFLMKPLTIKDLAITVRRVLDNSELKIFEYNHPALK